MLNDAGSFVTNEDLSGTLSESSKRSKSTGVPLNPSNDDEKYHPKTFSVRNTNQASAAQLQNEMDTYSAETIELSVKSGDAQDSGDSGKGDSECASMLSFDDVASDLASVTDISPSEPTLTSIITKSKSVIVPQLRKSVTFVAGSKLVSVREIPRAVGVGDENQVSSDDEDDADSGGEEDKESRPVSASSSSKRPLHKKTKPAAQEYCTYNSFNALARSPKRPSKRPERIPSHRTRKLSMKALAVTAQHSDNVSVRPHSSSTNKPGTKWDFEAYKPRPPSSSDRPVQSISASFSRLSHSHLRQHMASSSAVKSGAAVSASRPRTAPAIDFNRYPASLIIHPSIGRPSSAAVGLQSQSEPFVISARTQQRTRQLIGLGTSTLNKGGLLLPSNSLALFSSPYRQSRIGRQKESEDRYISIQAAEASC